MSYSVQFSSVTQSCPTLCDSMNCSTPGLPVHHQVLEFTQTHVHWVGDAVQPSHPLLSPSPPALNFPSIRVFSDESALRIRWPKYWSFSFSISEHLMNKGNIIIMEIIPECNPQNLLKCFLVVLKEPRESIKRLRKKGNFYLFIYWLQGGRGHEVKKDSLMALPGKGRHTRLLPWKLWNSHFYMGKYTGPHGGCWQYWWAQYWWSCRSRNWALWTGDKWRQCWK